MTKKIIIIVILIIVFVVGGWYFVYKKPAIAPGPEITEQEKACIDSGGIVTTANCCQSASDFPNNCLIGACGCAPEYSHEIKTCECPNGCWDGTKCLKNQIDTSDWKTYNNPKYAYTMKYPSDWTVKHEFGTNEILGEGYYESNRFDSPSGYALLFAVVPQNSDVMPIPRTGVGAGDFVDSDETINVTANINGTEVTTKYLVFEGKVKEIFFNDFETDGFWGRAYLSYFGAEDYRNFDMADAEEIEIAKAILESFEFARPSKIDKGFCGRSTNGTCSSDEDCLAGGCSGQVCQSKDEEPVITTCEYRDCYNAQAYDLTCGCLNKKCQWQ
jgi:eight-cysteine-cluster-containing protein